MLPHSAARVGTLVVGARAVRAVLDYLLSVLPPPEQRTAVKEPAREVNDDCILQVIYNTHSPPDAVQS
jgi:hypothetical protein